MQRWLSALVGAAVSLVILPSTAKADFGYGMTDYMSGNFAFASEVGSTADGGVLIYGNLFGIDEGKIILARLDKDGRPLKTFGKEGVAEFKVLHGNFQSASALLQRSGGRTLMAGTAFSSDGDIFLVAADRDGNQDKTFGIDGQVILDIDFGSDDRLFAARLATSGKILLFGNTTRRDKVHYFVARLLEDGSLDSNFGDAGYLIAAEPEGIEKIELSPSGTHFITSHDGDVRLTRIDMEGELDKSFGNDGVKVLSNTARMSGTLKMDSKGRLILMAGLFIEGDVDVVVSRLLADGTLDTTFGDNGSYTFDSGMGWSEFGMGLAVDASDRILVPISLNPTSAQPSLTVLRLLDDGSLDSSFGDAGFQRTMPAKLPTDNLGVSIENDGRLMLFTRFGIRKRSSGSDTVALMVARFREDGSFEEN